MERICLVCGFDNLYEPPYSNGVGSYEICPCCGFQFGNDDFPDKNSQISKWREEWIKNGCIWFSTSRIKPKNWNAEEQLKNID